MKRNEAVLGFGGQARTVAPLLRVLEIAGGVDLERDTISGAWFQRTPLATECPWERQDPGEKRRGLMCGGDQQQPDVNCIFKENHQGSGWDGRGLWDEEVSEG